MKCSVRIVPPSLFLWNDIFLWILCVSWYPRIEVFSKIQETEKNHSIYFIRQQLDILRIKFFQGFCWASHWFIMLCYFNSSATSSILSQTMSKKWTFSGVCTHHFVSSTWNTEVFKTKIFCLNLKIFFIKKKEMNLNLSLCYLIQITIWHLFGNYLKGNRCWIVMQISLLLPNCFQEQYNLK